MTQDRRGVSPGTSGTMSQQIGPSRVDRVFWRARNSVSCWKRRRMSGACGASGPRKDAIADKSGITTDAGGGTPRELTTRRDRVSPRHSR